MTTQSTEDVSVPDSLADLLQRAAAGVPPAPPSLDEVRRRHRQRRQQRSLAVLAGVGVLVAASIVTPRLLAGPAGSATDPTTPLADPPAQRLLLAGQAWVVGVVEVPSEEVLTATPDPLRPNFGYPPGSVGVAQIGPQEVTESGEVVPLNVPGAQNYGLSILGDGRILTLEWDTPSGPPRSDDRCGSYDVVEHLRLYHADGTRSLSRDVHAGCLGTLLAGATDTEAYLIRVPHDGTGQPTTGRRLVAHNLADGSERTVADLDALPAHADTRDVNVGAGRVAAVADSYGCQVQVLDIDTGAVTTLDVTTLIADCMYVDQIRLSPDGGRLGLAYRTGPVDEEPYEAGFAVVDLAGPALRVHQVVQSASSAYTLAAPGRFEGVAVMAIGGAYRLAFSRYYPAGIAWSDESTVRFAWVWLPDGLDRVAGIEEVLNVRAFTVP